MNVREALRACVPEHLERQQRISEVELDRAGRTDIRPRPSTTPAATLTPRRPRRTPATRSIHRLSSLGGVQTDQSRTSIEAASPNGANRADQTP